MRPFSSRLFLGALLVPLTACSSTLIDATVTTASRPTEGVEISMDCPQVIKSNGRSLFGKTDANGRFEFREGAGGRWIHDGCDIVVGERRFPVKSVCVAYSANHCVHAVVTADLATGATLR